MAKKLTKVGKTQLGSGIDALFSKKLDREIEENPEKVVKDLSNTFAMIPLVQIEANPDQPRKEFDKEALEELADSIKVHGIIQPLTVRRMSPKEYQIISGERRWRASLLAGLESVPAYIRIANDQTLLEMALIENIQREDLNAFEIAVSYYRLKEECQLTDESLAERVGKKRSTITNYLRLLDLHIEVLDAIKRNTIAMGHARAIASIKDKLLQKRALEEVINKKLSVRETEKMVKSYQVKAVTTEKKPLKNQLTGAHQQILDDFRAFFGSKKVKIQLEDEDSGKGQIVIPFEGDNELTQFFKCIEQ